MKSIKKKKPSPVSGYVISVSTLAIVGMMVTCSILGLAGVGLMVGWFVAGLSIWALIAGILMAVIGPLAVAMGIYRLKVKERLIVGEDCFQIVHRVLDKDEVITQIPYANMASIKFERGQNNYVGIDVDELNEPNTYQKNNDFESTKSVRSFHCVIDPGFTETLETIYDMIAERFQQHNPASEG